MVNMLKNLYHAIQNELPGKGIAEPYILAVELEKACNKFSVLFNSLSKEAQSEVEDCAISLIDAAEMQGFINGYRYALLLARIPPPGWVEVKKVDNITTDTFNL